MNNSQLICISEIEAQLDRTKPPEEQIKQAFRLVQRHWLITEEGERQRCALAAVMVKADERTRACLTQEIKFFEAINMASRGIPVDFGSLVEGMEKDLPAFGIAKLWNEVKKEAL